MRQGRHSERKACQLAGISRSAYQYRSRRSISGVGDTVSISTDKDPGYETKSIVCDNGTEFSSKDQKVKKT